MTDGRNTSKEIKEFFNMFINGPDGWLLPDIECCLKPNCPNRPGKALNYPALATMLIGIEFLGSLGVAAEQRLKAMSINTLLKLFTFKKKCEPSPTQSFNHFCRKYLSQVDKRYNQRKNIKALYYGGRNILVHNYGFKGPMHPKSSIEIGRGQENDHLRWDIHRKGRLFISLDKFFKDMTQAADIFKASSIKDPSLIILPRYE